MGSTLPRHCLPLPMPALLCLAQATPGLEHPRASVMSSGQVLIDLGFNHGQGRKVRRSKLLPTAGWTRTVGEGGVKTP